MERRLLERAGPDQLVRIGLALGKVRDRLELVVEAAATPAKASARPRELKLDRDATVWAIQPSPAQSAASLELRARRPDGSVGVLLWMPRCLPEWPQALVLQQPAALPAGTTLSLYSSGEEPGAPASRAVLSVLR